MRRSTDTSGVRITGSHLASAVAAALLAVPGVAASQPASVDPGAEPVIRSPLPEGFESPELRKRWRQGIQLERSNRFLDAAAYYEDLVRRAPDSSYGYWKTARNYWRHAETMPPDAKDERLPYFVLSNQWAGRGLEIDDECAECMLWKFGAMGRIGTTQGVLSSLRLAPEMAELLDRGIELQPTYVDDLTNSTLGNLYYAGAVFYRVVPDWLWLEWLLGVRGDIDRSLEMIRKAVEIEGKRIDYSVELGAVLLCYAQRTGRSSAEEEARKVLAAAPSMEHIFTTDELDVEHSKVLLREPDKACGYSRDGWIDLEQAAR